MTKQIKCPTELAEWHALSDHYHRISDQHMRDWFLADPTRFSRYSLQVGSIMLDYSRNRINQDTLNLLNQLAHAVSLPSKIDALFSGHPLNTTENRAVLHTALRDKTNTPIVINGHNIKPLITAALIQMQEFVQKIHTGAWRGATGKPIKHVVTIGVGGSHLGASMCCQALKDFAITDIQFHFIASVDATLIHDLLNQIDPAATLFIISSKTFTTLETMTNAKTLLAWMQQQFDHDVLSHHFIAITAATDQAMALGLPCENIFPLWDWVGGRYSVWSAIGLPLMLMVGHAHFADFLAGAYQMDQHFRHTEFTQNMPVILALLGVWYANFFNASAHAIIPYAHRLRSLIPYLQQADMESNGKHANHHGQVIHYKTGPVIFGEEGCHGQHAYHQLLHQGQHLITTDFILISQPNDHRHANHHDILLASGLSQASALMLGKTPADAYTGLLATHHTPSEATFLATHQANPGNRPSNILLLDQLTPHSLGELLALYEHKIFVQGVIWNINSFDQWGVELGKQLLPDILHCVKDQSTATKTDMAIMHLIHHLKNRQGNL